MVIYHYMKKEIKTKDSAAVSLGSRTSSKKADSARENGKKGGRPPKNAGNSL